MTVYIIAYKLSVFPLLRSPTPLLEEIKKLGTWWHYIDNAWLVNSTLGAQAIYDRLQPHLVVTDKLLVIQVTRDYSGWLPEAAWEWIHQNVPWR